MRAPDAVAHLVQRFASHRESYHSGAYNEARLRGTNGRRRGTGN